MDHYKRFLNEIENPHEETIRGELLGPGPCESPLELRETLPLKKKYLGPGPWYRQIRTLNQETKDEQHKGPPRYS